MTMQAAAVRKRLHTSYPVQTNEQSWRRVMMIDASHVHLWHQITLAEIIVTHAKYHECAGRFSCLEERTLDGIR